MYGATVTVGTTRVNLFTLLAAADTQAYGNAHSVTIESDLGNGAAKIFLGDSTVTTTVIGRTLLSGDTHTYSADFNGIVLGDIYMISDTAASKVNISTITV